MSIPGLAALLLVVPIVGYVLVAGLTIAAIQMALAFAIFGYIFLGVPWAIYRRLKDGYWPSAD